MSRVAGKRPSKSCSAIGCSRCWLAADSDYDRALKDLDQTSLDLIEDRRGDVKVRKGSLAEKVQAPDAVIGWLNQVDTADSLEQAWAGRGKLG